MQVAEPMVTVLMPVYNAAEYLNEAIDSMLDQTYSDFELLIINDGSTDESTSIINSYIDNRIRVIQHSPNQGLIASLNEGISNSRGKYIVRMDADDISLPNRIERQVNFMEQHPDVGLCGTWFEDFGPGIHPRRIPYSNDDTVIRIRHLYQTHIAHPTAIIRKRILDEHHLRFDPEYVHGEDYHFWVEMGQFCKFSNIPEILLRKRDHPENVSNKHAEIQRNTCNRVKRLQFSRMGVGLNEDEAELYSRFANPEWNFKPDELKTLALLLTKINTANTQSSFIEPNALTRYIAEKWFHLCLNAPGLGTARTSLFKCLPFRNKYAAPFKSRIRMVLNTIAG